MLRQNASQGKHGGSAAGGFACGMKNQRRFCQICDRRSAFPKFDKTGYVLEKDEPARARPGRFDWFIFNHLQLSSSSVSPILSPW